MFECVFLIYYDVSFTSVPVLLKNQVLNSLTFYSNSSEVNNFGGRFKYSKLNTIIDNTNRAITSNITKVRMRRDLSAELNKFATYEICFGNKFHQKTEKYNIKSSGFNIKDVADTLYLTDSPNDSLTGKIIFFKLVNNIPTIVSSNAGTVDYLNGEIKLNIVNISSTSLPNNTIEIQAMPESNDIIALKNNYLKINMFKTLVNTIQDVISSGENTSATEYLSTSSYLNGYYTR